MNLRVREHDQLIHSSDKQQNIYRVRLNLPLAPEEEAHFIKAPKCGFTSRS